MTSDFACYIDNIYENLNDKSEIKISPYSFSEVQTSNIEDCFIPNNASAVILFKNEIAGRDSFGFPILEKFNPTNIRQFVITTEEFLGLPKLYARYSLPKSLMDGVVGAYVLRDGTLFVMNERQKKLYTPILLSSIKNGKYIPNGFSNENKK